MLQGRQVGNSQYLRHFLSMAYNSCIFGRETMALFSASDCRFAENLSRLVYCNPFLPERLSLQQEALGANRFPQPIVWHKLTELDNNPNLETLEQRARELAARTRQRLAEGAAASEPE